MNVTTPDLAMITGSPAQWAALAAVVLVIFAPKLIPPVVRLLTGLAMRRFLGIAPPRPAPRKAPGTERAVDVLPPAEPTTTLRAGQPGPVRRRAPQPNAVSVARLIAFVALTVAVLSWLLLRIR